MYQLYLDKLKEEIRQHKTVKKQSTLNGGVWKTAGYEKLSDLIMDKLMELPQDRMMLIGSTISSKTLANVFKTEYKLAMTLDPRTINTLTKLSIFAGYIDWDHFVECNEAQPPVEQEGQSTVNDEYYISVISRYILACFVYIQDPTETNKEILSAFTLKGIHSIHPIMNEIKPFIEQGYVISNPFNPSEVELSNLDIEVDTGGDIIINTNEQWILCWWDIHEKKYVKRWRKEMDVKIVINNHLLLK